LSADDLLLEPPSEARAGPLHERIFTEVIAVHEAEEHFNKERSKAGWWVGGIGAAIGVLGMLGAAGVAIAYKPQVRYTEIDHDSATIRPSYGAKDAPDHYGDRVIKHYLAEYITLRERFIWQLDSETDHRVKLMSSADEQARYVADRTKNNPLTKYGTTGYARVARFIDNSWRQRATGTDKTIEYEVQFIKSELLASNLATVVETHMTARIAVQFHPEIDMSEQDRLGNESGMIVFSYASNPD